ncbi:MAG: M48 family metalloprotease [Planctomycetes bacterium]|nr:M48 family metalloprotease [Planctomycetota bacterium]
MFNILGILLALIISSAGRGSGTLVGWESIAAVAGGTLAVLFFYYSVSSHLVDRWQLIQLRQMALPTDPSPRVRAEINIEREVLLRRLPLFRMGVDALILGLFIAQVFVFGWTDFVADTLRIPMYLDVLPNLAPYFLMLGASWVGQYRIQRHIRADESRPLRYLMFQARANLLTILPIALIYTVYWVVISWVPHAKELRNSFEFLEIAVQLVLVILISLFVPLVIRLVVPGGPMPDGRLRRRLETFAKDRGLRVSQIMVWRTGSRHFATAFVIGLVSPFRYVFFTDALLKRMSEDEIVAVFAHEMGHVHHRHLWWLLAFILSFTVVMLGLDAGLEQFVPGGPFDFIAMGALLAYGYFAFGYISRRFERQADAYAAEHTSPEHISSVLLRLGMENPTAMKRHGWRHFSLERRVREIILHNSRPEVRPVFRMELVKGIAVTVLVTLAATAALVLPVRDDVVSGLATFSLSQFHIARESNASPERLDELRLKTLDRSQAMAQLRPDYEASAYWYEGQVQILTGHETDAFERMAAFARRQRASAKSEAERAEWERWEAFASASEQAARRARDNNTSFDHELTLELQRHGRG